MTARVVVTGASGFIGRALVARMRERGRDVVALGRAELGGGGELPLAEGDVLVHLAARAHRGGTDADFAADVALTQALARAAARCRARRFVHMSSIGVLGASSHGTPLNESTTPSPTEPYARAKLEAERALARELAPAGTTDWVILRPPMVYGPHAPGNFARLMRPVRRGWPLPFASIRNRRHLVAIENLIDAIELCVDHPAAARQTFVVADAEAVSTPQLVALMAQGLGVKPRLWPMPTFLLRAAARATGRGRMAESLLGDFEIDCGHIRRTLGWQPALTAPEGIVRAAASSLP